MERCSRAVCWVAIPHHTLFFKLFHLPALSQCDSAGTHGEVSKAGELMSLNFAFSLAPILQGSNLHLFTPKTGKLGGKD